MRTIRLHVVVMCVAVAASGCGKEQPGPEASDGVTTGKARKIAEIKVPSYAYPAPVKGHIKETNIGEFDLVDGIAYPSMSGSGTVVYVASKPIASPMLVDSACPLTQARALAKLRNASFAEITLDAGGKSKYFDAGCRSAEPHRFDAARLVEHVEDRCGPRRRQRRAPAVRQIRVRPTVVESQGRPDKRRRSPAEAEAVSNDIEADRAIDNRRLPGVARCRA